MSELNNHYECFVMSPFSGKVASATGASKGVGLLDIADAGAGADSDGARGIAGERISTDSGLC